MDVNRQCERKFINKQQVRPIERKKIQTHQSPQETPHKTIKSSSSPGTADAHSLTSETS